MNVLYDCSGVLHKVVYMCFENVIGASATYVQYPSDARTQTTRVSHVEQRRRVNAFHPRSEPCLGPRANAFHTQSTRVSVAY